MSELPTPPKNRQVSAPNSPLKARFPLVCAWTRARCDSLDAPPHPHLRWIRDSHVTRDQQRQGRENRQVLKLSWRTRSSRMHPHRVIWQTSAREGGRLSYRAPGRRHRRGGQTRRRGGTSPHRAGTAPPSSPRSWARAFRLLLPARQNARASCIVWTWAPALMVLARSERAYTASKRAFKGTHRG